MIVASQQSKAKTDATSDFGAWNFLRLSSEAMQHVCKKKLKRGKKDNKN